MIIHQLELCEPLLEKGKKPYDEEYYKALFYASSKLAEVTDPKFRWLITDTSIYFDNSLPRTLDSSMDAFARIGGAMQLTSKFTALLNRAWPTRALVYLNILTHFMEWSDLQDLIRKRSLAVYQLVMENPNSQTQPSLFGTDFYLSYDKTPAYFREGIFLERVLS